MKLSKPALDVGFYTNQLDSQLSFWQLLDVPFVEMLPVGNGVRQHRHAVGHSVVKVNHARTALPAAVPSGLRSLALWLPSTSMRNVGDHRDPDGNTVLINATDSGARLSLNLVVSNLAMHQQFYGGVLGLPASQDGVGYMVGESQICLAEGETFDDPPQKALGLRYMTFQVFDVRAEHEAVLAQGGAEGMAPVKLGEVAHISFIRDPDGNWIELSQRKSITGSLD